MTDTSSIRRLSCYAVLNIGFSGENYLLPHLRLVLSLIAGKDLKSIDARELVDLFQKEYQYKIDFFPMRSILGLAVTQGYLIKKRHDRHYKPTDKLTGFANVSNEIGDSERELAELATAFQHFAATNGVEYSIEDVNTIISAYINTQKLSHISGHIETPTGDKRTDYLFGKFVYDINFNRPHLMSFLTRLVTGSILADCLMFHEQLDNGRLLDDVTVVFDTALVFMALGIDEAQRQEHYVNLIKALRSKGARIVMFKHSYNEMQNIILGSADWVENYQYDPLKASETTAYFRSINATKENVIEYSSFLKQHISELGIDIVEVDCDKTTHPYYEDESKIYSMIVEKYASTNRYFNETAQKRSMELDSRSLSHIYVLRKGQVPMHISDCSYLFVTANRSLNKVASEYHRISGKLERSLPVSVTDVFLGTYIWLSDPVKITEMNERMMIANAYLAFQPNSELISKLSATVHNLLNKGEISSQTCYALMGNKLVLDKLAEKTLGDPDAYQESTPLEILQEMLEESKREGANEVEKQFNAWKQRSAVEKAELHHKHIRQSEALNSDLINMTKLALDSANNELSMTMENRRMALKYRSKWKAGVILALLAWFAVDAFVTYRIWKYDVIKLTNWLDLYTGIGGSVVFVAPLILACIMNHEVNIINVISKFLDKRFDKKCEALMCTLNNIDEQKAKISKLQSDLQQFISRASVA